LFIGIALSLFLSACTTTKPTAPKRHKNLSYLYNESEAYLHPQYQVYHYSTDSSIVFIKLPFSDLLMRPIENDQKYGFISIHYRQFESLTNNTIIDSSSFNQKVIKDASQKYKLLSFKIGTSNLSKTFLSIELKDQLSERTRKDYIEVDRTSLLNRQNLLIKEAKTKEPVFGSELLLGHSYSIQSPVFLKRKIFLQEQQPVYEVAFVPYSTERYASLKMKSDTSYLFDDWQITPQKPTMYFLNFDTNIVKGVSLMAYDSITNRLHTPSQLIQPLNYLLSKKEFNTLLQDTNPKFALDRFWLKTSGNVRHAQEMIRVYYGRAATANREFASYKEGWMTDRGMIYLIFGEPVTVYKSETLERWIYGSGDSEQALSFDFEWSRNPFTSNDYRLVRNEAYQKAWAQAIDSWRNGRIYSVAK